MVLNDVSGGERERWKDVTFAFVDFGVLGGGRR